MASYEGPTIGSDTEAKFSSWYMWAITQVRQNQTMAVMETGSKEA